MACSATDIPSLQFPRDEIIEIIPASYNNSAKRIHIDGLPQKLVPSSPEDIKIPVPPSGAVTPFSGLGTPAAGSGTPTAGDGTQTPVGATEGGVLPIKRGNIDPKA
jgi:6-phosphofructo-2-kinase/fructose-2,6-biphosphatase 4